MVGGGPYDISDKPVTTQYLIDETRKSLRQNGLIM